MHLRVTLVVLAFLSTSTSGLAQSVEPYAVPRTAHGHPDFQGVWATAFLTRLERPSGVESLVVNPEQAQALAATLRTQIPDNVDPQVVWDDIGELAKVKGEYRTSVIVEPENGQLPFTQAGLNFRAPDIRRELSLLCRRLCRLQHQPEVGVGVVDVQLVEHAAEGG